MNARTTYFFIRIAHAALLLGCVLFASVSWAQGRVGSPIELGEKDLTTKDGVQLSATFYPGFGTKDTIPIILLHDLGGDRTDFQPLIDELAPMGYAILAPDLRGHGKSKTRLVPNRRTRTYDEREIDSDDFGPDDFQAIVHRDMDKLRSYLVNQNNAEKLNLNRLVVVGAGKGANVAMEWTIRDWTFATLPNADFKQSRDVKALVMLSPEWQAKGFSTQAAVRHPVLRKAVPSFIGVGRKDGRALGDATKIAEALKQDRPEAASAEESEVWFAKFDTESQGTKLLQDDSIGMGGHIDRFINVRVLEGGNDTGWISHR